VTVTRGDTRDILDGYLRHPPVPKTQHTSPLAISP
jgi:hypothetical protein